MNPGLVVKLRPTGPWRIGPDSGARNRVDVIYHSDSLYSAVTSAMARLGLLEEWLDATARQTAPQVSFSSCFPFLDEIGFVVPPRSIWPPRSAALNAPRVRWKSARFVPLGIVQAILSGKRLDENQWTVDGVSGCLTPAGRPGPFRTSVRWSAAVDRLTGATERHSTACLEFRAGSGLWTIVSFRDEAAAEHWAGSIKTAFRLLADTGFGGERSRGWGRSEAPEFVEGTLPDMILGPVSRKKGARGQGPGAGEESAAAPETASAELRAPASIAAMTAPEAGTGGQGPGTREPIGDPPQPGPPETEPPGEPSPVNPPEPLPEPEPQPPQPETAIAAAPVEEKSSEPEAVTPVAGQSSEPEVASAVAVDPSPAPEAAAPDTALAADQSPEPGAPALAAEPTPEPEAAAPDAAIAAVQSPEPEAPALAAALAVEQTPEPGAAAPDAVLAAEPSPEPEAAALAAALAVEQTPEPGTAAPDAVLAADQSPEPGAPVPVAAPVAESTPAPDVAAPDAALAAEPTPEPEAATPDAVLAAEPTPEPEAPAPGPRPPAPDKPPTAPHWLLSLFTPSPADTVDWARGNYTLLTRGGRVDSPAGSGELKKQLAMLAEGSVIYAASAPSGSAPDVAPDGFAHPVFRAGFALSIPLPEVS